MAILHSIIGTVSDFDPRRVIECGCKWSYVSELSGDAGRQDCQAKHKEHADTSPEHAAWYAEQKKRSDEAAALYERMCKADPGRTP